MSIWGKTQITLDIYKRFWLAPAGVSPQCKSAQDTAAAEYIAWLLETDTTLRRVALSSASLLSASSSSSAAAAASAAAAPSSKEDFQGAAAESVGTEVAGASPEVIMLPTSPDFVQEGGEARVAVNIGDIPNAISKVLSALHFIMAFWSFDGKNPRLRAAYDQWWPMATKCPFPADEKWSVQKEVCHIINILFFIPLVN